MGNSRLDPSAMPPAGKPTDLVTVCPQPNQGTYEPKRMPKTTTSVRGFAKPSQPPHVSAALFRPPSLARYRRRVIIQSHSGGVPRRCASWLPKFWREAFFSFFFVAPAALLWRFSSADVCHFQQADVCATHAGLVAPYPYPYMSGGRQRRAAAFCTPESV